MLALAPLIAYVVAPSPDPAVVTAVTDGFGTMTSLIVTTLLPALFALVIIGLAIRVAVKYLRRGTSA